MTEGAGALSRDADELAEVRRVFLHLQLEGAVARNIEFLTGRESNPLLLASSTVKAPRITTISSGAPVLKVYSPEP